MRLQLIASRLTSRLCAHGYKVHKTSALEVSLSSLQTDLVTRLANEPASHRLLGILSNSVPKRPILFFDLYQVDEDVFQPQAEFLMQSLGKYLIKGLLHFQCAALVELDFIVDELPALSGIQRGILEIEVDHLTWVSATACGVKQLMETT